MLHVAHVTVTDMTGNIQACVIVGVGVGSVVGVGVGDGVGLGDGVGVGLRGIQQTVP